MQISQFELINVVDFLEKQGENVSIPEMPARSKAMQFKNQPVTCDTSHI